MDRKGPFVMSLACVLILALMAPTFALAKGPGGGGGLHHATPLSVAAPARSPCSTMCVMVSSSVCGARILCTIRPRAPSGPSGP